MNIRSSWNSDRVASCCSKKSYSPRTVARKPYFIAQYKGCEISILGPRGGKLHSWTMNCAVSSAIVRDGILSVETIDGSTYDYDASKGVLISSDVRTKVLPQVCVANDVAA